LPAGCPNCGRHRGLDGGTSCLRPVVLVPAPQRRPSPSRLPGGKIPGLPIPPAATRLDEPDAPRRVGRLAVCQLDAFRQEQSSKAIRPCLVGFPRRDTHLHPRNLSLSIRRYTRQPDVRVPTSLLMITPRLRWWSSSLPILLARIPCPPGVPGVPHFRMPSMGARGHATYGASAVLNWAAAREFMVFKGQWAVVWRRPALPEGRPRWGRSERW
jgi:hypothetical protein